LIGLAGPCTARSSFKRCAIYSRDRSVIEAH
jgi:hypothetical protein